MRIYLILIAVLLVLPAAAHGQSNFTFFVGGSMLAGDTGGPALGTCVGTTAKFNIAPAILLRTQFNADRIQENDAELPDFRGAQTHTFVEIGFGIEAALSSRDVGFFVNLTPHGTIRTLSRILEQDGKQHLWKLTRFSVGATAGFGFEAYVTDNIGFEMQLQYDLLNIDHSDVDPILRTLRAFTGVQFYLGRNFVR